MARPLRIEFPGAFYHVTARGNRKNAIYEDDADRLAFLEILSQIVDRCNWRCHAYCLMSNHYHLVVETPDGNLSYGMRQLNGIYTQRYNRRHHGAGHIFQGRFKSIIVEKESYLLELCRYVVLNPVRAGLTEEPAGWQWSSYGATAGLREAPGFLTTDWLLSQFAPERQKACESYQSFVMEATDQDESLWNNLRGQFILGGDQFTEDLQRIIEDEESLREVSRKERFVGRPSLREIFQEWGGRNDAALRNRLMHDAYTRHGYTLTEIGTHLNMHYSTVSKIVKTFKTGEEGVGNSKFKT